MARNRPIRPGWFLQRLWAGPTWEYTILTVHHRSYQEGSGPVVSHSVVVLRDGIVQARVKHDEVTDLSADQQVRSTWFERYLPGLLDDMGAQGWRIVSVVYGGPIRVVFARPR